MNTLGLRAPSGTGTGETVYLIGPLTAESDDEVSAEINDTVSASITTTTSAEADYLELEE